MLISFLELKKKDVIDISTGKNLGKIINLFINEATWQIEKIIVSNKGSCFLSNQNIEIDYKCITKIGQDSILYKPCKGKINDCCKENDIQIIDCEDE